MQVEPEAHTVGPVHPIPPHCPYSAAVPAAPVDPDAADVIAVVGFTTTVDTVVGVDEETADVCATLVPPPHTAGPGGV